MRFISVLVAYTVWYVGSSEYQLCVLPDQDYSEDENVNTDQI